MIFLFHISTEYLPTFLLRDRKARAVVLHFTAPLPARALETDEYRMADVSRRLARWLDPVKPRLLHIPRKGYSERNVKIWVKYAEHSTFKSLPVC